MEPPTPVFDETELLTVNEAARIFRTDPTTVRRWIKNGALEAVILPHINKRCAYRIKRSTVNAIIGPLVSQEQA